MKKVAAWIGACALAVLATGCGSCGRCDAPANPSSEPRGSAPAAAVVAPAPAEVRAAPSSPVAAPAPATSSVPGIPAGAKAFGGHHYLVIEEQLEWHAAKKKCEELGGYLACIETEAEQKFIAELAAGRYLFLGASDEKEEGKWRWVNGAPFTFTCWREDQPNNYGGDENFLETYDGGEWCDVAAEGNDFWMPTGFICEWDK